MGKSNAAEWARFFDRVILSCDFAWARQLVLNSQCFSQSPCQEVFDRRAKTVEFA